MTWLIHMLHGYIYTYKSGAKKVLLRNEVLFTQHLITQHFIAQELIAQDTWHDSFICDTTIYIYIYISLRNDACSYVWHEAPHYVKRKGAMTQWKCAHPNARQMRDTPHSHVPWLFDMCHDSFTRAIWLMHGLHAPCPIQWVVSHSNDACHACEWVMAHVDESWHMWISHVTCEWVMSRIMSHSNEAWHACMSHVTHECVIWRTHMWHDSFIRDINPPHVRHDSCTDLTRLADARNFSVVCDMSQTHMWHDSSTRDTIHPLVTWNFSFVTWNFSFVTWNFSFVTWNFSFVTRNLSFMCDMTHPLVTWFIHSWHVNKYSHVWHDAFISVTRLIHMCDMTHGSLSCGLPSLMHEMNHSYVTWLIHMWRDLLMCDMTHSRVRWLLDAWRASFTYDGTHSRAISLIHVWRDSFTCFRCDAATSYMTWFIDVWRDSFIRVTWRMHMCDKSDMTHFMCIAQPDAQSHPSTCDVTHSHVTWLIHMWHGSFTCDMAHSRVTWLIPVWHDSFPCDMTHSRVTWLILVWRDSFTCDVTHSRVTRLIHEWHDSFTSDMTHSHVRHERHDLLHMPCPTRCVKWLIHEWRDSCTYAVTQSRVTWLIRVWHDSFTCDRTHSQIRHERHESCTYCEWVMSHVNESCHMWMSHVTCEWQ